MEMVASMDGTARWARGVVCLWGPGAADAEAAAADIAAGGRLGISAGGDFGKNAGAMKGVWAMRKRVDVPRNTSERTHDLKSSRL